MNRDEETPSTSGITEESVFIIKEESSSSSDYDVEEMLEKNDTVTNKLYDDVKNDFLTLLPFVPEAYGLPSDFRLTNFGDVKSSGTRPSLQVAENEIVIKIENDESTMIFGNGTLCTLSDRFDTHLIETSYALTPSLINNPYVVGKIACLSILSGIYALGIVDIATIRMNLALACGMEPKVEEIVIPMIIRGFKDAAKESGSNVKCADITMNDWCQIGGIASAICTRNEFIPPDGAVPGDVIVLTKPLGTSIALTAAQWLEDPEKRRRLIIVINEALVKKANERAIDTMLRSNKEAAVLLRKYNAHAACEVSSQGILGHAMTLAKGQKNAVDFVINNLPIIATMRRVAKLTGDTAQLLGGSMPEYSGGLLIVLPREQAAAYCKVYSTMHQSKQAWIIGTVQKGERKARLIDKPRVLEVPPKESDSLLWEKYNT